MRTRTGQPKNGFTLVEALVAISILMIAIASPMVIAEKGLTDAVLSGNETTASFLAQEGVESVKNIRDGIALYSESNPMGAPTSTADWLTGGASGYGPNLSLCIAPAACNIDGESLTVSANASAMQIIRNASGQFVSFGVNVTGLPSGFTAANSMFSRSISIIQSPGNPAEAKVVSVVSWRAPSGLTSATSTDFIYNYAANLQY